MTCPCGKWMFHSGPCVSSPLEFEEQTNRPTGAFTNEEINAAINLAIRTLNEREFADAELYGLPIVLRGRRCRIRVRNLRALLEAAPRSMRAGAMHRRPRLHESLDAALDPGIKRFVFVLREAGVETFESCEGGNGHAFLEPTVRFHGERPEGFRALAVALAHRLPVIELRRVWPVLDGEVTGPCWELTFSAPLTAQTLPCQVHPQALQPSAR